MVWGDSTSMNNQIQKPLISVIIPVYNVEKYLCRCIDSVLLQTYRNLEVILIDDGSTDNCPAICDKYAKKDNRIKVIRKKNGGLSDARNKALDIMQGEYVTFIDSDDYVSNDYVEYLFNILNRENADISIGNLLKTYERKRTKERPQKEKTYVFNAERALETMLYQKKFDTNACGKMYRSSLFSDIRYPTGFLYEDFATTYLLIDQSKKIVFGSKVIYYYFQRSTSIINTSFHIQKVQLLDISDQLLDFIKLHYPNLQKAAICRLISASFHIYFQIPLQNNDYSVLIQRIEKTVKRYCFSCLINSRARFKNRVACGLSYIGMNRMRKLVQLLRYMSKNKRGI